MEDNKIRQRSEIPVEDRWAVEDMYATDALWDADLEKAKAAVPEIAAYAGHLADSAESLLGYLQEMERLDALLSDLGNYCMRRADEDTRVGTYQAMRSRFMGTAVALNAAGSFETPEVMAISDEALEDFFKSCPALERYRRYLTETRRLKAHTLSTRSLRRGRKAACPGRRNGAGSRQHFRYAEQCRPEVPGCGGLPGQAASAEPGHLRRV